MWQEFGYFRWRLAYIYDIQLHSSCVENQTHILCSISFIPKIVPFEIMWFDTPDRPQMTVTSIHLACWIANATNTLRICNTVLNPFPRRQFLSCSSSECGLLRNTKMGQTLTAHIGDEQFHWVSSRKTERKRPTGNWP